MATRLLSLGKKRVPVMFQAENGMPPYWMSAGGPDGPDVIFCGPGSHDVFNAQHVDGADRTRGHS
jgi:hypothetical protein